MYRTMIPFSIASDAAKILEKPMRRNIRFMYFKSGKDRMMLVNLRKPIMIRDRNMSLAGYVRSKLFHEDIGLIIDYRHRDEINYEYACASMGSDGRVQVLMEPEIYLDFVRGKPYARTTILHELGHVFYNDLPEIYRDGTEYDVERLGVIEAGNVHEREIRADAFAARFLGTAVVSEGLSYLREADIAEDEEANAPSILELGRRIQLLMELSPPER